MWKRLKKQYSSYKLDPVGSVRKGIYLCGCTLGVQRTFENLLKRRLCGINPLRLQSMITTIPQYDKTVNLFEVINARISRIGKISDEERNKIKEVILSVKNFVMQTKGCRKMEDKVITLKEAVIEFAVQKNLKRLKT